MGEATIEAPARSSCGPIMAARAGGSSATDCSMDAPPTANPLAAATGALKPGGRPALEKAAVARFSVWIYLRKAKRYYLGEVAFFALTFRFRT